MIRKGRSLIVGLVLLIATASSYARDNNPTINIRVLNNKIFALYISTIDKNNIHISIKNELGYTLTELEVNENVFATKYNLTDLENGNYTLEIMDDSMTRSYPIEIKNDRLNVLKNKMITSFKPIIKQNERMVDLMVFSPGQVPHEVTIYDENSAIVHDETFKREINIQKKFDFTEVAPGAYSMVINTQGHKYTYSIPVK